MAWPEDKTKVKRMQPSPIMQRANRATGRTFQAAANVADRYAGGAGMKQGAAAVANAVAPAVNRIAEDAKRNTVARQVRNLEIPYGDQAQKLDRFKQGVENRQYGGNSTFGPASQQSTVALRDKVNSQSLDNPSNTRKFSPPTTQQTGPIMLTNRTNPEGEVVGDLAGFKQRDKARRMQPASPYSVQFDESVSPEARARFMQDPVRSTAQINRFRARQAAPVQQEPQDNSISAIGERVRANKRDLALRGIDNERSRIGIEGDRAQSEIAARSVTTEAAQAGLGNVKTTAGLEAELLDENTPPERRKQIEEILGRTKKPTIEKLKEKDPIEGTEQERLVMIDDQGNTRDITPGPEVQQAPQAAITLLMSDPAKYSEMFLQKYGYLPEGLSN